MIWSLRLLADPPLDPTGDDARRELRLELARPEYYDKSVVRRLLDWLGRVIDHGVGSAGHAPPLTWFAGTAVVVALLGALVLLLSRARRTARTRSGAAAVLTGELVSAAQLRARAERALADGRYAAALVDGFRALAVRQVERGRLEDTPGATAHEVARALGTEYPGQSGRVEQSASLFDAVLYGDRPASRDQAAGVLNLDDELTSVR